MKQTMVADVMTRKVVAMREGADFKGIVEAMRDARVSAVPVVDSKNHVLGVVSEGDLLIKEAAAVRQHNTRRWHGPEEEKATEILAAGLMTRPAVTIGQDATVAEAAGVMSARRVKRLPVVDDWDHLIGIISRVDVLSVYTREDSEIRDEVIGLTSKFGLDPRTVEVTVTSGIVTIAGQIDIKASAPYLLDDIRHVEAVVDVRDRLSYARDDVTRRPTELSAGRPPG